MAERTIGDFIASEIPNVGDQTLVSSPIGPLIVKHEATLDWPLLEWTTPEETP